MAQSTSKVSMFSSAKIFVARLTEVEKAAIRGATNPDRLDWLFQARHRHELVGTDKAARKIFDEAVASVLSAFTENSQSDSFGRTWAF